MIILKFTKNQGFTLYLHDTSTGSGQIDSTSHFWVKPKTLSQSTITCSKFTIETLEQGVKYVQS